ncbi:MAG: hypothetical protein RRB13_14535 [bacterium]|nr:hypothetical protein [bacterium]
MSVQETFFCESRGQRVALLACPSCRFYPCGALSEGQMELLCGSPMLELAVSGLEPRRRKMFLIKYKDGSYKEVEDFDPSQPNLELLEGMDRVFQVNREWVPQMVLRPKPRAERQKLLDEEIPSAAVESDSQKAERPLPSPESEEPELIQVSFL